MPRPFVAAGRRAGRMACAVGAAVLLAACAEPPAREINQAQGAIDTARAAGAEQYASAELAAAVAAVSRADEAVAAGDYRQALAYALDAREQAQLAARTAADARSRARGNAERALAETTGLVERVRSRLASSGAARPSRRAPGSLDKTIAAADVSLQEARTALDAEAYGRVEELTARIRSQMEAALASLDAAATPQPLRRR